MKPRIVVLISLSALIILVFIQYYSISQVYQLKGNEFDLRYSRLIQQALYDLEYNLGENGLDPTFYSLDSAAFESIEDLQDIEYNIDSIRIYADIVKKFQNIILSSENLTPYIRTFLSGNEADPDFISDFVIRKLEILDFPDEHIIYDESGNYLNEIILWDLESFENALQVNSYAAEGNYYRITFDFFIDFTHKRRIIYQEMAGIFTLSVITIFIVLFIFIYTINNMMKQKKLSDMKSDFINNMTHELKTPLTTISVASSSLADPSIHSNEERVVDISRMIGKQNMHLNQLIDHILDVELWERNQVVLTMQPVDISKFLSEKIKVFRMEHQDDTIEIIEEYNLDDLTLKIDEFQFTRVMNNLLSNAVKYSFENTKILVKADVPDSLILQVRDNGIGIDQEAQKNIFSKFYRADTGKGHKVKGLGLGLYYVKKIIEAHGGEISVESNRNMGSNFIIKLPK